VDYELTGKRVLVTGGTRGIGRETVLAFARGGARVVAVHRRPGEAAENLSRDLKAIGDGHRVVTADVTDPDDVTAVMGACRETLGGLDVVVNNVGVDGTSPFADLRADEWNRVLDSNLTSTFLVTQASLKLLVDGGSIVDVGASVAVRGRGEAAHYVASKAALLGLARSAAKELGKRGIRINTVAPGLVETEPDAGLPPQIADRIRSMTALGRLGTPADVAATVLFLASDASAYLTGTTINVDGGM
jgi:3-oxoacyl-[acyl-carrier protein] reductase